jgi:spore coat protein U-like protein
MKRALFAFALAALPASAGATACTASSSGVNFGEYDPFASAALEGAGGIDLRCDELAVAEVSLGSGQGTYAERRLVAGANALAYNLFTSSQFITVWGDGTGSTASLTVSGDSATLPVYGLIAPRQNVPAGMYSDIIIISIIY